VPDIPSWYGLLLLALAAWRTYRLISEDTILEQPRRWLLRLAPTWEKEGDEPGDTYRFGLGSFITCPYCAGFWISLGWWGAWMIWPHATLLISVPLAINTILIGVHKLDEKP